MISFPAFFLSNAEKRDETYPTLERKYLNMEQKKLTFSHPRENLPAKRQYAYLELLSHSAYICDESTRILFRNSFAASAFPHIRTGMLFSRFCPLPLSDGTLLIRPMQGFLRYLLCTHVESGRFEIQIPGGLVIRDEQMPREGVSVRALLESVRTAAKRLAMLSPEKTRSPEIPNALGDLGELLKKCLSDLESPADTDPRLTVAVRDLLEAVRRRSARDLADSDTHLDYDCPSHLLCSARITPTVFILLNLICFFRLCAGQKRIFIRAREEESRIALELCGTAVFSPTPFYAALFGKNTPQALDQALLATPFSLAAATAAREGLLLDCSFQKGDLRVALRLPLLRGMPDLTVMDPDALDQKLEQKGVSRPVCTLLKALKS